MSDKGWITVHRKIQECWIWEKDEPFDWRSAWIDLLLLANHADKKKMVDGELITIKRGQRLTSIRWLAERWKWSRTKVTKFLDTLEQDGMLTRKSDTKKTLLTIENYGFYQDVAQEKSHQNDTEKPPKSHQSATEEPPKDTNNNDNNVNNDNNGNKNNKAKPVRHKYGEYKNVFLSDDELEKLKDEFPDWSRRIENLSEYMASSGKSYKNHLATIRTWARKEKPKKTDDKFQSIADWASKEWQ